MRILHTADWHLGRALHGQPFLPEQEWLLTGAFLDAVREARPDLLVIAGDLYDRAVPPAAAVELLGEVLRAVIQGLGVPVLLIAGNHDDARRLGFAAPLLGPAGLHIAGCARGRSFLFQDRHGPVRVLAADYGAPAHLAELFGPDANILDHEAGFAASMAHLRAQLRPGERSLVVAHAFVQGGEESESERLLQVGGSGAVSAAHLAGFHYVALGHLHRPQAMAGGRIRYAGSPLGYSFSEAGQQKSLTLVELDAAGGVRTEALPLPARRPLRLVQGTLEQVLDAAEGPGREDWLQVWLADRPFDAMARLRERYPNVLDLRFAAAPAQPGLALPRAAARAAPLETLEAFWQAVRGEALPQAARADAQAAIAAAIAAAETGEG
ncbi:exonuclease SbcCD subunit D [Pseudoroseomonas cervicalis]|uniref:exonuclease SbcCD subunit D n=1 Tax=Teichococcus cervicalis TaxID=204525 RepID=UPI00277D379C|nr:exonuclease SbcCD subunit D [Pseudoroseomonas cervicalis]MDQ1081378.1 exonuclease SbcD [Pseudoroseomonas cervicalis]